MHGSSTVIYHIAKREDWEKAQTETFYFPAAFFKEKFIHFSTRTQLIDTANRLFRGHTDLCLLIVDTTGLEQLIRYENLEGGEMLFPHLYGKLPVNAVRKVVELIPNQDGCFSFPEV